LVEWIGNGRGVLEEHTLCGLIVAYIYNYGERGLTKRRKYVKLLPMIQLKPLSQIEGVRSFISTHRISGADVDTAIDLAYQRPDETEQMLKNPERLDAQSVLAFALRGYFPANDYEGRIKDLLYDREEKQQEEVRPFPELAELITREEFLKVMPRIARAFKIIPEFFDRAGGAVNFYGEFFDRLVRNGYIGELHEIIEGLGRVFPAKKADFVRVFKARYSELQAGVEELTPALVEEDLRDVSADTALLVFRVLKEDERSEIVFDVIDLSREAVDRAIGLLENVDYRVASRRDESAEDIIRFEICGKRLAALESADLDRVVKVILAAHAESGEDVIFSDNDDASDAVFLRAKSVLKQTHGIDIIISDTGGYGSSKRRILFIREEKPRSPQLPKLEIIPAIKKLSPENAVELQELMIQGRLLGLATAIYQKPGCFDVLVEFLEKIIGASSLFVDQTFIEYTRRLLENVRDPESGQPLRRALAIGLPSLRDAALGCNA
jgi:hypothetical protein